MTDFGPPPPLLRDLASARSAPSPVPLLALASALAASATPQPLGHLVGTRAPRTTLLELIHMFGEHRAPELDAVLSVWSVMLGDDVLRRRSALGRPAAAEPAWLGQLAELRPVRVAAAGDVYGAEETLLVELLLDEHVFTIAAPIALHGLPTLESAYPLEAPLDALFADIAAAPGPPTTLTELTLADGGARLREALALHDSTIPDPEDDDPDWPSHRPLLEWVMRLLPEGGAGYGRREWAPEEISALLAEFVSTAPERTDSQILRDHTRILMEFNVDYGCGDPLRWGPQFAERVLMDLIPRKVLADATYLGQFPEALMALIPWANRRAGLPEEATARTLQALAYFVPGYLALITETTAASAFPAELFTPVDEGGGQYTGFSPAQYRDYLIAEVGTPEELESLDDRPLPSEPLKLAGMRNDARDQVRAVARLLTEVGGEFFGDPELVAVASRLLERLALVDPGSFRGRIKDANLAVALCWLAAKNNQWFERDDPARTAKALMSAFATRTSPLGRAETMLRAMGKAFIPGTTAVMLGDPALLVSWRRRQLIESRDDIDRHVEE